MQPAELPPNETQRLASLHSYGILDSEQEGVFDELAELAANICDAPIALISLVDESRQWFKARIGLEAEETARSVSFCAHAILQPGVFIVPDTLQDERFVDNSLVTGPPHIRFYAGAPLFTGEGYGLGTLCIIDHVPRELNPQQQKALSVLRIHVLKLLDLRRKTRELAEVNRELEVFSHTVSHDLRAPLRAIKGFSQMLLEDHVANLNEEAQSLLQRISNAADRMDQLTIDLINLSRWLHYTMQFRTVDLTHLAHDVISELEKAEPTRQVDVNIHPGLTAVCDAGLFRVVIENLLGNAWKFTSKCAQTRIEFGKELVNGKYEFFVRDNGVGFEMAYARKLFQPFQRLHSSSDYPGTGVGLATVKRIIQRHGGTIRAESTINQGTAIRFTLQSGQRTNMEEA